MNYNDIFIKSKLPKPLKKEELFECIRQAREGSLEARDKVITYNIKLVLNQVLKKFANAPYEKKDLVSIGTIGLVKAVDTFDITKKFDFSTYAIRCINNEILMFMRKGKRYLEEESLDQPIGSDKDGKELRVEDTIADEDADFVEDVVKRESLLEVRRQVDILEGRDKEIVKLYFGFYDDKQYSQEEIGNMMGLSCSYISRIINRVVNAIGKKLEEQNLIERVEKRKRVSTVKGNSKKRKDSAEKMAKELQTIYEYFNQYTREQVDEMLGKLTEEEKLLITLRYGQDLDHPKTNEKWDKENNTKFYGSLVPKMRRLLSNPNNERKPRKPRTKKVIQPGEQKKIISSPPIIESEVKKEVVVDEEIELLLKEAPKNSLLSNDSITKEECVKILELLRTPTFTQMMELLSPKDAIIISLKLGYVDGKYFSTKSIANFLKIEEDEVRETTKKALLLYKANINEFIDNAVKVVTDQPMVLSLKFNGTKK